MNENIFNKLSKQGVLGLCTFDVLDLPIAEKVKTPSSLAAHIVPLTPTGVCLYCPCIRAKETFKKSPIQPPCRNWHFTCRFWHFVKPVPPSYRNPLVTLCWIGDASRTAWAVLTPWQTIPLLISTISYTRSWFVEFPKSSQIG